MTTPRVTVPVDGDEVTITLTGKVSDTMPGRPGWFRVTGHKFIFSATGEDAAISLSAAPAPEGGAGQDAQAVTLDWRKVETTALEEWRAEYGDCVALVVLGHDNVWSYRVNNIGHLGFASADEAKAQALSALRKRLSARLNDARATVALYDAAEAGDFAEVAAFVEAMSAKATSEVHILDTVVPVQAIRSLLRAQPPAREGAQPVWMGVDIAEDAPQGFKDWAVRFNSAHPAPDALRGAMEALEPFAREAYSWPELADDDTLALSAPDGTASAYDITMREIRLAASALAALQAEQKGGA